MTSTTSSQAKAAASEVVEAVKEKTPFLSPQVSSYFIAGGVAGAASRTVVSPLERLKIIQQVQSTSSDKQYKGVFRSLVRIWNEEGFKGYMRGNGINCVRIIPYSAVQFTTYEQLKKFFTGNGTKQLDTPTRLVSGALAGITSVCTTYPLDLIRSRLSIASANIFSAPPSPPGSTSSPSNPTVSSSTSGPGATATSSSSASSASSKPALSQAYHSAVRSPSELTMWGMTQKVMREEGGVRALYRGMVTTALGVAPYVGINFASYELLRGYLTPPGKTSVMRKLACGALAGAISQSLTYPFDVVRRKMQVVGMGAAVGYQYNNAYEAVRVIIRHEGILGMYRGLWPNLLKVAPSISVSFFSYELVKDFLLS
ncbi:mitochondrial carrier [Stereum hirsutum FP-91666 SS1]|uniref:mitochondrial carrier n=1 Tax=Stereum hirsutum (strain FP-91666) TaxID=721885 RepID=UPI0004449B04|nr:mitochondrial carrier [Stereum hirsutum FP-91666 SS1]EIM81084.1 mitochondrial carrier [Stereum hirsutum FP-91666 SS1]